MKVKDTEVKSVRICLECTGPKTIATLKTVRHATGLSLKDAKSLIDRVPVDLNVPREFVEEFRKVGARVAVLEEGEHVDVELCVVVDSQGRWAGIGWSAGPVGGEPADRKEVEDDDLIRDFRSLTDRPLHRVWVKARVPLPRPDMEVQGDVEPRKNQSD